MQDYRKKLVDGWGWLKGQFSPVTGQEKVKAVVSRFEPHKDVIFIALLVMFAANVLNWKPRKIRIG